MKTLLFSLSMAEMEQTLNQGSSNIPEPLNRQFSNRLEKEQAVQNQLERQQKQQTELFPPNKYLLITCQFDTIISIVTYNKCIYTPWGYKWLLTSCTQTSRRLVPAVRNKLFCPPFNTNLVVIVSLNLHVSRTSCILSQKFYTATLYKVDESIAIHQGLD